MTHFTFDEQAFAENYPKKPFVLEHDLADHPLFSLEALVEAAERQPEDKVEYTLADIPHDASDFDIPTNGLSRAETIRQIESCKSWMLINNVERLPEYKAIVDELIDEIALKAGKQPSEYHHRVAVILVTSPGGTTPFHIDTENNFLLHMRGRKSMTLVSHEKALPDVDIETHSSKSRYLEYRPSYESVAFTAELLPGQALNVPFNDPHYVVNGPEVSVSMSITWHTKESWHRRNVGSMNHMLRAIGLPQARPGVHPRWDAVKAAAFEAINLVLDPIRKNEKARMFVKRHILRGKNVALAAKAKAA